jgi:lactoylglutathione lyase
MCEVHGFFHAGITVSDMARSIAFYRDGIGLELDWEKTGGADYVRTLIGLDFDSIHNVFLKIPGGGVVELLEYHGIERMSAAARPCDPGSGHLCLYVHGIEDVVERARKHGGTTRSASVVVSPAGATKGCKVIYVTDPDGFIIELFETPDGKPFGSTDAEAAGTP